MNDQTDSVGTKLKELRKSKKITLNELAKKTGLSVAYLSNIERSQTSPTINNLFKISSALQVEIIEIMENIASTKTDPIMRKNERENLFNTNTNIVYENITANEHEMSGVCISIDENCYDEVISTGHAHYSELGIVIEGSIILTMNGKEKILYTGDTVYIGKNIPHGYKKYDKGACVTYWVYARNKTN